MMNKFPKVLTKPDDQGWLPLHYAAYIGSNEFVKLILEQKPSVAYKKKNNGNSALHIAAKEGRIAVLQTFLKLCPDSCEILDFKDQTALHITVSNRRPYVVRKMLELGSFRNLLNQQDKDGNTPLHLAALVGSYHIFLMLIVNEGIDKKIMNNELLTINDIIRLNPKFGWFIKLFTAATNGDLGHLQTLTPLEKSLLHSQFSPNQNTPLHVATEFRQLGFAKAIVRNCEPLLWLQNGAGDTALHVAAREALPEFVEFFIQFRRLLRMVNLNGDTALHCAARIGSLICVEKIVEAEPELCGIVNNNGESPLYLAVAAGYWEVPEVIIHKANLLASYKGAKGLTALHPTLFYPNYDFETIKSFVEWRKEMIKEQDDLGLTPLHYASLYGRTKAISLFLQNESSSIYIVDNNNGESALHIAAFKGHKDAVEEILNRCQDSCYLVDNKGRTPLHAAVLGNQRKVVKLILGRVMEGRVMNKADCDGNMALHLAAFHKFYDIIEILATSENVDLNVTNKEFLTALDMFNKHDLEGLRASVIRNILKGSTGAMTMQHLVAQEIKKMNQEITIIDDDDGDGDDNTNGIISIKKKESSYNAEKQNALEVNLLVATLVATVTFAAGFSMPGGYFENIGLSILSNKGGFKVFLIFNTIAFCCSVFAVLLHFHTSITDHYQRVRYMGIAVMFTSIAIVAMVIAFASGTHVVIANAKAFSLTPFVICGGFAFLYFAIPFCDPGVEGYSFLHIPQRFIRGKIVKHIRYEE